MEWPSQCQLRASAVRPQPPELSGPRAGAIVPISQMRKRSSEQTLPASPRPGSRGPAPPPL